MGLKCSMKKEICGAHCTSYDGTTDKEIIIKKDEKLWAALINKIPEGIWCDDCRHSYIMKMKGISDLTNYSTSEIEKPRDTKNLKQFMQFANCVYDKCIQNGDCE